MMPAWYQRMNPRERVLAWVAAGTVFALLNFFILDWVFGALATRTKADIGAQGNVSRTSSLRERTRPLDKTRRMDPPASTNSQGSSRSLRTARSVKGNSRQI